MALANYAQYSQGDARQKYHELMQQCISLRTDRLGSKRGSQIGRFMRFLGRKSDWYQSPASTKYHLACPGGLLIHSVVVAETAIKLRDILMPAIPLDSVIFCGMYHDIGKVYCRVADDGSLVPRYVPNILKTTGKRSTAKPFLYNGGANEIPLTVKDMLLPTKFVDLSDAEMQALMFADGPYASVNESILHNETPLSCVIHWADFWSGHVIEGQYKADWLSGILTADFE